MQSKIFSRITSIILTISFIAVESEAICFNKVSRKGTPSPIDIDSSKVIKATTTTKLTLFNAVLDVVNLTNTGKTLDAYSNQLLDPSFITGGVLCGKKYKIHTIRFYISQSVNNRSGNAVDGKGLPLEMTVIYYNILYGSLENALKFPDGITIVAFPMKVISIPIPNVGFVPLKLLISSDAVKNPHSSFPVFGILVYVWFDYISPISKYYAYIGSYYDPETGKQTLGANYIVLKPDQAFSLSEEQYKVFKNVLGLDGKPLVSAPPVHPQGSTNVYEIYGISQVLLPVV